MESSELFRKLESFLDSHPHASLQIAAVRLGVDQREIEQALRDVDGTSFAEFQQSRRLSEAFKQLGTMREIPLGPWEKIRTRPRTIIPKTTIRYRVRSFLFYGREYSDPCPLIDLSSGGLAFLADVAPMPGKRVSLAVKFPHREEELLIKGDVVYTVATGIAGYRYRIGIQFLPFGNRKGLNSPQVEEVLIQFEGKN